MLRTRRVLAFAPVFAAALLPLSIAHTAPGDTAYGAYGLYPQGSSRAMGMGGAYTAISDSASGIIYNPAGLSFGNWNFDASGTSNRVDNRETESSSGMAGSVTSVPYNFTVYAGAARLGDWVIGAGYGSPYQLDQDEHGSTFRLKITSVDLMVARKIGDVLSVGITGHNATLTESYQSSVGAVDLATSETVVDRTAGLALRWRDFGIGATYQPARRFNLRPALNSATEPHVYFRDVLVPEKTSVGIFKYLKKNFLLSLDVDFIGAADNAILAGSGTGYTPVIALDPDGQTVIHGGFEWTLVSSKSVDLVWRAGAYREPSRLADTLEARNHFTFGVEVRFGPALLSVSFDQAPNFNNTSQGFSVSIGSI